MKNALSLSLLALCALLTAGCMMGRPNLNADTSTRRVSKAGTYEVTYEPSVLPVPKRSLHAWTVHVRTRDGRPVDGAQLRIDGGMPDHGHGLPTRPTVREALGHGTYVVEGMKFNMGGYWVVDLAIAAAEGNDDVRFELNL
jgi:YtkA-like